MRLCTTGQISLRNVFGRRNIESSHPETCKTFVEKRKFREGGGVISPTSWDVQIAPLSGSLQFQDCVELNQYLLCAYRRNNMQRLEKNLLFVFREMDARMRRQLLTTRQPGCVGNGNWSRSSYIDRLLLSQYE